MKPFVRWLSAMHIAQVWLVHANDSGKSFGDKTREWEMDAVIFLSPTRPGEDGEPDQTAIKWEWRKARLRMLVNADQFKPFVIRLGDEWTVEDAPKGGERAELMQQIMQAEFVKAYDRLANAVDKSPGFDHAPVLKVAIHAIAAELKSRGFLMTDEKDKVTNAARTMLSKAKAALLRSGFQEQDGLIWRSSRVAS